MILALGKLPCGWSGGAQRPLVPWVFVGQAFLVAGGPVVAVLGFFSVAPAALSNKPIRRLYDDGCHSAIE